MAKTGFKGQPLKLELHLDDGTTGKYPRAYVYNESNTLIEDIGMPPANASGTYSSSFTPSAAGYYFFVFKVYTSNLYNVLDTDYNIPHESAYVYDKAADVAEVAGAVWDVPIAAHQDPGTTGEAQLVSVDLSNVVTDSDLAAAVDQILTGVSNWEAKGTVSFSPTNDSMEMVVWLVRNGVTVFDANSAAIELRDGDDNIIMTSISDPSITPASGLFKFIRLGASAIIFRNRTYVMKITITRGTDTYIGNVSISTY